ncbi:MAG: hypothetical protein AB7O55_03335 [Lautropia sp.]
MLIALATGAAGGGWLVNRWTSVRVDRLTLERDRLSEALATRDNAIAEHQRSQRRLSDAAAQCSASITMLAQDASRRESEAAALREDVRRYLEPSRAAIARLDARIRAGGPAAADCRAALDEWRAEQR